MTRPTDPELDLLDLRQLDDAAFERHLLAAAAQDAPPPAASARAFRELSSDAHALAALTALAPAAPARAWYRSRSAQRSPLGWLLLGAVAGGSVVALWLTPLLAPPAVPPAPPRPTAEQLAEPPLVPEAAPAPPVPEAAQTPQLLPESAASTTAASSGRSALSSRLKPRASAELASRLAREVAALDAARAALAVGATSSVLEQIARYHREFPAGELTADADAVAIEALAAERDHAALALAAQRFLQRHPHDPHAPRVRELAFIKPPAPPP
ncbi:MAG: hypothetical protein RL033_5596 [Pseudomonadota bacterium]|jgi:hypothetical protein